MLYLIFYYFGSDSLWKISINCFPNIQNNIFLPFEFSTYFSQYILVTALFSFSLLKLKNVALSNNWEQGTKMKMSKRRKQQHEDSCATWKQTHHAIDYWVIAKQLIDLAVCFLTVNSRKKTSVYNACVQ